MAVGVVLFVVVVIMVKVLPLSHFSFLLFSSLLFSSLLFSSLLFPPLKPYPFLPVPDESEFRRSKRTLQKWIECIHNHHFLASPKVQVIYIYS